MLKVYTDSPNGRYKTIVSSGVAPDSISSSFPSYSPGIHVTATSRTNIGCYNSGFGSNQISAEVRGPAGNLINTYLINLPTDGWNQIGINDSVSGGYIRWRPASTAYCYAVVVDNTSNDGSLIPASDDIQ